jgi:PAS domain S-box-containing protein
LRRSQEVAHIGNWVWNISSNSLIWSDEMYNIFGIDKGSFTGNLADVMERSIHPDDKPRVEEANRRVIMEGRAGAMDYRVAHQDGTVRHVWARPDAMTFDADGNPVRLTGIVQDITERKKAEELLKSALAERETLLRELYHRTKNNMQVINSMLDLQSSLVASDALKIAFKDTQNRIQSMSLVHQKLYQSQSLEVINLSDYSRSLIDLLISSYVVDRKQIAFEIAVEDILLTIDSAVPCGLIINELIANALKYAFPDGRSGHVLLKAARIAENEFLLEVSDDGIGVPPGFDFAQSDTMGMVTISMLARQLGGSVAFNNDRGVTCRVHLKSNLYKSRLS